MPMPCVPRCPGTFFLAAARRPGPAPAAPVGLPPCAPTARQLGAAAATALPPSCARRRAPPSERQLPKPLQEQEIGRSEKRSLPLWCRSGAALTSGWPVAGMAAGGRNNPTGPTGQMALRQRGGVPAARVATRERRRPCVPAREHGDEGGRLGQRGGVLFRGERRPPVRGAARQCLAATGLRPSQGACA